MTWFGWLVTGVPAVLLAVSWWYDRDARRRGARVRSAGELAGDAYDRRKATLQRLGQKQREGMTPRSVDDAARTWRRTDRR